MHSYLKRLIAGALLAAAPLFAGALQAYAPTAVSVTTNATTLLAADPQLQVVQLTNLGTKDVWVCEFTQTPVVGQGFRIPSGGTLIFSGENAPRTGLKAIADGATCVVAVGKG